MYEVYSFIFYKQETSIVQYTLKGKKYMNNNNDNNHISNDVIIKLVKNAKSKYFLLPGLSQKPMGLLKKKMFSIS